VRSKIEGNRFPAGAPVQSLQSKSRIFPARYSMYTEGLSVRDESKGRAIAITEG
jgi:hypothetical protein